VQPEHCVAVSVIGLHPAGGLLGEIDTVGGEVMLMVTLFDVTCVGFAQLALEVIWHVTGLEFNSAEEEKVAPLPCWFPFTYHTYEGLLPPLVGDAVNVTKVFWQTVPDGLAVMETDGVINCETFTVNVFDDTGLPQPLDALTVYCVVLLGDTEILVPL
jgi:hypothetical protein